MEITAQQRVLQSGWDVEGITEVLLASFAVLARQFGSFHYLQSITSINYLVRKVAYKSVQKNNSFRDRSIKVGLSICASNKEQDGVLYNDES